jgi:hypothetical protein
MFLVVLLGCQKPAPRLQYIAIGIAEDQQPVVFAVKVNNMGNTTVTVDRCDTNITFNYLLAGPGNLPDAFNYNVTLIDTEEALKVKPGETATIPFSFIWNTPFDAPPMVAICRASFTLRYDATSGVETEPVMFTVANVSQIDLVKLGQEFANSLATQSLLNRLNSFQGKKSANVQQLIRKLRSVLR